MSIRDSVAAPPPTRSFRIRRRLVAFVGAGLTVCRERRPGMRRRICGQRKTVLPRGFERMPGLALCELPPSGTRMTASRTSEDASSPWLDWGVHTGLAVTTSRAGKDNSVVAHSATG